MLGIVARHIGNFQKNTCGIFDLLDQVTSDTKGLGERQDLTLT